MNNKKLYKNLTFQVLIAILLGITTGVLFPHVAASLKLLSDLFIRLITMLVGPIIFCTIVLGISNHQDIKEAGKIGLIALIYFEITTTLALLFGFITIHLVKPGVGITTASNSPEKISTIISSAKTFSLEEHFLNIFPHTITDAFSRNDLLQILFFSVLFGIAMALTGQRTKIVKNVIEEFSHVMFRLLHIIIHLAPLAAFGAMSYTVSTLGIKALMHLGELILCVYLTALFFITVVLGTICYLSSVNLWQLLLFIKEEIIITFATSSSEAVLPQLIEKLEKFGCSKEVVGLVIPTGYSFNLDGTSIYLSAAALFIAQAYGIHLDLWQQITLLGLLMLYSKGAAAVAGGGLITLTAVLSVTHILPVEGIALILGVDRFMSEARSVTNVIGNSVAVAVISKWDEYFKRAASNADKL